MDIQKIKELALANGFLLKEQASGNMDLHSYVYEFAQAVAVEILNQAQLVYGQDGVTTFDTESLDNEISKISREFEAEYFFDNDDADRLEMLIAKSMRLGELYERQKWQAAKAQAVPEHTNQTFEDWLSDPENTKVYLGGYRERADEFAHQAWIASLKAKLPKDKILMPRSLDQKHIDYVVHQLAISSGASLISEVYQCLIEALEPTND